MEAILRKSDDEFVVKEEKRVESIKGDKEGFKEEIVFKDNQLESVKSEMGEVREENQRLKMYLNQIMKDYKALQVQFYDIVRQEAKESSRTVDRHEETEESKLVSLSLGRTSSDPKKDIEKRRKGKEDQQDKEGLALGLDCKFEVSKSLKPSPENSSNEVKDEAGESWRPAHKVLKTMRSGDDEVSEQNPVKKARVSVRVRCDTPTMNDGCQWRKYGQKIAKGNPCPRAYYRCTVAPLCPVRKQVQRCAEDMSILITTYEGTHNHPLPISATAMASTTSAAASMLMSGSSSSGAGPNSPSAGIATSVADLRGLNFYLSDNLKSNQFYLPYSSISSSPSCPTITLDLTSNSSSSSSSYHFNQMCSNFLSTPRYSSTNLNFSSLESNPLPMPWTQPYNKNQVGNSLNIGRQSQENFYQSFMQKSNPNPISPQQPLPEDSIAAVTKAITSDPSFQSALADALTSIIGTSGGGSGRRTTLGYQGGDKFGQNLKLGEPFPVVSNFPSTTSSANKCSSSYLNRDHIV